MTFSRNGIVKAVKALLVAVWVVAVASLWSNNCKSIFSLLQSPTKISALADDTDGVRYTVYNASAYGVDPVYLKILEEAERRSAADFASSHQAGTLGVVIGPTEGQFERHTLRALRNARRIRNILAGDKSIKVAFMTSPEHIEILNGCGTHSNDNSELREACRLWANNSLFDDVISTKDGEYHGNEKHTDQGQGTAKYWLKAMGGYRYAPYKVSLFLDSDAFPCPGFDKLFYLATRPTNKYWQIPSSAPVDFAAGIDQFAQGTGNDAIWIPGDPTILKDYPFFAERNTGTVLFHFAANRLAHTFAHFIPLVAEHVFNYVATEKTPVINDQCPFRIALYLFCRLRPEFNEQVIPMHTSCRTYPGYSYAGTDGFLNGMFPMQQDGKPCKECSCTPCLITHTAFTHEVLIDGRHGWEDERFFQRPTTDSPP
jgi:hypothetical protein